MAYENEPLKKIKVNLLKDRAMSIVKGSEAPPKFLLEWIKPRLNNYSLIQKTLFNVNNNGPSVSAYVFSIKGFVKARYPKLTTLNSPTKPTMKQSSSEKSLFVVKKANRTNTFSLQHLPALIKPNRLPIGVSPPPQRKSIQQEELSTGPLNISQTPLIKRRPKLLQSIPEVISPRTDLVEEKKGHVILKHMLTSPKPETTSPILEVRSLEIGVNSSKEVISSSQIEKENIREEKIESRISTAMMKRRQIRQEASLKIVQGSLNSWRNTPGSQTLENSPKTNTNIRDIITRSIEDNVKGAQERLSTLGEFLVNEEKL